MVFSDYLELIKKHYPGEMITINDEINPADFQVSAVLSHLESDEKYPLVYFSRPLNLKGEVSNFPLITNVFANSRL